MKLTFTGKKVLVTGGNSDIALCLARLLVSEGLEPVLTWRSEKGLNRIERELEDIRGRYQTARLDFSDMDSVGGIFQGTAFDYLVDLAQGDYESLVASSDPARLGPYIQENITVRAELVRLASRSMMKNRFGRLLFVSSAAAGNPSQGQGFYAASKLASEALYRNVGLELGPRGVTSLILRPGYVEAGRGKTFIERNREGLIKKIPGRHLITAQELSETLLFFLSDSARSFNGVDVTMDGGLSAGKSYK